MYRMPYKRMVHQAYGRYAYRLANPTGKDGRMKEFLRGWVKVDNPEKITEETICDYCGASPDDCGEYVECCFQEFDRKRTEEHDGNI